MSAPFTDEDRAFLRGILTSPADLTGWLAYADWLDDRDDPRSEFVRLQVRFGDPDLTQTDRFGVLGRLQDLAAGLDPNWVAVFDRPGIENCDDLFAFKCPRKWERLRAAGRADVRSCDVCRKDVYYCHTIGEARAHAREGRCVAVAQTVERLHDDLSERAPGEYCGLPVLGRLRVPDDPPPVITRRPWWKFW